MLLRKENMAQWSDIPKNIHSKNFWKTDLFQVFLLSVGICSHFAFVASQHFLYYRKI